MLYKERRFSWFRIVAGVLTAALWAGCAHCPEPELVIGTFTMFNRQAPYLIAAPHGVFDEHTGDIVYDFCGLVRWDCLVAEGFRDEAARINVNRPTEGLRLTETRFTESAATVYSQYVRRIRRLSPNVLFYAEIHGHEYTPLSDTIDIATVGISESQARFIHEVLTEELAREKLGFLNLRIDVLEQIATTLPTIDASASSRSSAPPCTSSYHPSRGRPTETPRFGCSPKRCLASLEMVFPFSTSRSGANETSTGRACAPLVHSGHVAEFCSHWQGLPSLSAIAWSSHCGSALFS